MEMDIKNPLDMLWHWEEVKPNSVFLSQPKDGKWINYTWKDVANEVRRMAGALKAQELEAGSRIATISKNDAYWIISDLAIMAAGHISVPLYPNLNKNTINQILSHSGSKYLFVGKLDNWEAMRGGIPSDIKMINTPLWGPTGPDYKNWDEFCDAHNPIAENTKRANHELASIIYTSGTTGMAKGVMHTFLNFGYASQNAIKDIEVKEGTKFFSYLPLCHIAERLLVEMGGIVSGGTIYFAESLETFQSNLQYAKPNVFLAVPRIWSKFQQGILSKMPQAKLDRLLKIPIIKNVVKKRIIAGLGLSEAELIFSGAAPIAKSLINWFSTVGVEIQEAYAMTENCCYSHVTRKNKIKVGSVGQPLRYVDVKIGEGEEILIKHDALMTGYYRDEQKTNETIVDGYLRTGDQGRIDADGFLFITGRVKDLFKTDKGKYIAPAPIELKISANPLIEQVILIGTGVPMPIALVALSEEGMKASKEEINASMEETRTTVNPTLDHHEHIDTFIVLKEAFTIENGMLTPTMKVKRNEVERKYLDNLKNWYDADGSVVWE